MSRANDLAVSDKAVQDLVLAGTAPVGDSSKALANTQFVQAALAAFGLGTTNAPATTNLNNLSAGGMYFAASTATGLPIAANSSLLHVPYSDTSAAIQIVSALGSPTRIFYRTKSSGAWNAWKEFAVLDSPALNGNPTAPTADVGDNDLTLANTAFVQAALRAFGIGAADNVANNTLDLNAAPYGSFIKTESVESDATRYNRPVTGTAGTTAVCFDVLTFGLAGRTTQYATQLFAAGGRGRTWIRVQHDTTWYPWREVVMTDSPALLGNPTAPTAPVGDNDLSIANTAFVQAALAAFGLGTPNAPTVTDLNAISASGMYFALSTAANLPIGFNGTIIHAPYADGSAALQIYSALATPTRIFYRTRASGVWNAWKEFAVLDSPAMTGNPTAPTAAVGDNDKSVANTEFVQAALAAFGVGSLNGPLSADLNTAVTGGFFRAQSTTLNSPSASNLSVIVAPFNNGGCLQIASLLAGSAVPRIWYRTQAGGTWSNWSEILTMSGGQLIGPLQAKVGAGNVGNTNNAGFVFDLDTGLFSSAEGYLQLVSNGVALLELFNGTAARFKAGLRVPKGLPASQDGSYAGGYAFDSDGDTGMFATVGSSANGGSELTFMCDSTEAGRIKAVMRAANGNGSAGWTRLLNGDILQWTVVTLTPSAANTATGFQVTWPTAFPNGVFQAFAQQGNGCGTSPTQITIESMTLGYGGGYFLFGDTSPRIYRIFAIGR